MVYLKFGETIFSSRHNVQLKMFHKISTGKAKLIKKYRLAVQVNHFNYRTSGCAPLSGAHSDSTGKCETLGRGGGSWVVLPCFILF